MAKPYWVLDSNTTLGTLQERVKIEINLQVHDPEDRSTVETDQFSHYIDSTIVENYADDNFFYIKSNGLAGTAWAGPPPGYDDSTDPIKCYNPKAQSYVFKIPRKRAIKEPLSPSPATGFVGVARDGVPIRSPNSGIVRKFGQKKYTQNAVIDPVQSFFLDGSGIIGPDRKFYYHSDPKLIYTKDPTTHSPIIGYAFDGNPIYGPYGLDEDSTVFVVRSSYQLSTVTRENGTYPDGTFIEDFEYIKESGDLDEFNGRFCRTPEYPGGVYAYFVTVDPNDVDVPRYPYIVGPKFYSEPIVPNGIYPYPGNISVSLLSGKLPSGLGISGTKIVGTPYEVARNTTTRFVLRASNINGISDRTFSITVEGPDAPYWSTPEGLLPIGENNAFYVLDNSIVDFNLYAVDLDLAARQRLTYYIPPKSGELPPGLSLSETGRITGFTEPLLAVNIDYGNGNYDRNFYDKGPYDYGLRPTTGWDTYLFDSRQYDYSDTVFSPRKLNRYYEFIVRATDGTFYTDRKFRIYLVGDDHLRSDTTVMHSGTGMFTADTTYLRKPIWITPTYLGVRRANNYQIIQLEVFDPATLQGSINYKLEKKNPNGTDSILPPGITLDTIGGELYGSVPYQPAITITYNFTVTAFRYDGIQSAQLVSSSRTFNVDFKGDVDSTIHFITSGNLGYINANFFSTILIEATTTVTNAILTYEVEYGTLPPGLTLLNDGTLQGKVNQFASAAQPGLTTFYESAANGGFTNQLFDNGTTSIDRKFNFVVKVTDQFNTSSTTKTFSLRINTPNNKLYSNIYVKPFPSVKKRLDLITFLTDPTIFERYRIYRASDPEFGVQSELKMLLYPGIETKTAADYVSAFGRSSRKRFRMGEIKKAIARRPATTNTVYEIVYIEILDNSENENGSIPKSINTRKLDYSVTVNQGRRDIIDSSSSDDNIAQMQKDIISGAIFQEKVMSADYGGQRVSDAKRTDIFGNSVTNMRSNIAAIGETERNFLPLWMRTAQSRTGIEQGFVKAITLCYCLPGQADYIILNIKNSGFDFKSIDFTADRVIIDSTTGDPSDKYIAFAAREVING